MRKVHIYLLGVASLGLAYELLKAAIPSKPLFFAIAVIYLIVLRLIAERFGRQ